jgi:hypothetical protein
VEGDVFDGLTGVDYFSTLGYQPGIAFLAAGALSPLATPGPRPPDALWCATHLPSRGRGKPTRRRLNRDAGAPADMVERQALCSGSVRIRGDGFYYYHHLVGSRCECALLFPKLALGLSGFETGVAMMPLVKGMPEDKEPRPAGKIRNTHHLLFTAALIMSLFLLSTSLITTLLIPADAFRSAGPNGEPAGPANGRALPI